jgi:hypothetical protein
VLTYDVPPWEAAYQRTKRWIAAGSSRRWCTTSRPYCAGRRMPDRSAAILDGHVLRSSPDSGHRAGYDGAKSKKSCSKVQAAVDTLGTC